MLGTQVCPGDCNSTNVQPMSGFSRAEWRLKPDLVKVSPGDTKMTGERKRRRRRKRSGNKKKRWKRNVVKEGG